MKLWILETNSYWQIIFFCSCLIKLSVCADDPKSDAEEVPTKPPIAGGTEDIGSLNQEICLKNRKGCCNEMDVGDEATLVKCFTLNQSKLPKDGEKDPAKLIRFLSCFVECQYKQKKYIGKGDNINMKMVKNDAEKMYHDRPKEKEFHIELFEYCRKDATTTYNMVKSNPAAKFILRDACKPFFMFVFLCQSDYHKKARCPYFKWKGKKKTPSLEDCKEAKDKCYEIDGLQPPPEIKSL